MDLLHEDEATEFRAIWPGEKPLPKGFSKAIALCGRLEEVADELVRCNKQGYGIFAIANQVKAQKLAKGGFTRTCHLSGVNAVWVDIDKPLVEGEFTHLGRLLSLAVPPSLIAETSSDHYQAYWLVESGMSAEMCVAINRELAHKLGGDFRSINASRVLRVPGFNHTKRDPEPVLIRHAEARIFASKRLECVFGAKIKQKWTPVNISYVQDRSLADLDGLSKFEQQRLAKMRKTHAKERTVWNRRKKIKQPRNVNPDLPTEIAYALCNCETLEQYAATLMRLWPKQAGCRQTFALAVGGDLYKFGCSGQSAMKIVEAACEKAGDAEVNDRQAAVISAYRRAQAGKRVVGTGAGAPMTTFEAIEWGVDLRSLSVVKRRQEARRRILGALRSQPADSVNVIKCSSRALAEMTGVSKNTVNKVLVEFAEEGVLKRVPYGVIMSNTIEAAS